MTIPAYPLQWPTGWKRTPPQGRRSANFRKARQQVGYGETSRFVAPRALTIAEGVERVRAELKRMGISDDDLVISSNLRLRLDGFPSAAQSEPADPGIAVYWREFDDTRRVMAIDLYDRVADNLAAVAATLDAMRAIERHGGAVILERAFTGFTALPAPGAVREWWEVLGVLRSASRDEITAAYRRLRSEHHPDKGGSAHRFDEVEKAYRESERS